MHFRFLSFVLISPFDKFSSYVPKRLVGIFFRYFGLFLCFVYIVNRSDTLTPMPG